MKKTSLILTLVCSSLMWTRCADEHTTTVSTDSSSFVEGIELTLNDGKTVILPGEARQLQKGQFSICSLDNAQEPYAITWNSGTPEGAFYWNIATAGPVNGNTFFYKPSAKKDFQAFTLENKKAYDCPGQLEVTSFGEVGGFVTGTFTLEKGIEIDYTRRDKPTHRTAKITGRFKVRRTA
jgi:hypothetical protein